MAQPKKIEDMSQEEYRVALVRTAHILEKDRCLKAIKVWLRPDHIRLHAGEMTAQEMRTAIAVARGIFSSVQRC